MSNGYFQLICSKSGTSLKIMEPRDGGQSVYIRDIMDYLNLFGVRYNSASLNKGLQDARLAGDGYEFQINEDYLSEVRGGFRLNVSPDKMTATVRFYPPSSKGTKLSVGDFLEELSDQKVVYGVKTEEIRDFFDNLEYCTDVTVAEGLRPRKGVDAKIDYFFDTNPNTRPTLKSDGSVDFFHLNNICHCKQGELLAKLTPADLGDIGYTVSGEKIKPPEVKRASLTPGKNVILSEDKLEITAETDGHVMLSDGKVTVSNVLELENVDLATGNIDYNGSVNIKGNVCTNFSVKATGNIEVMGIVEGAYLQAGGDIIIARGMNGMARGVLKATGNVIAKFIENSKVSAGGYVSSEAILHSEIMAGVEVMVNGRRGFISGGKVSACDRIQVKTLGSSMGSETVVEVGVSPDVKFRAKQLQKQIIEKKRTVDQLRPHLANFSRKLAQGIKFEPEQIMYIQEMLQKQNLLKKEIEAGTAELASLQRLLEGSDRARVEVSETVYAGVRICISDVSTTIKSNMPYCKFIREEGEVKSVPL